MQKHPADFSKLLRNYRITDELLSTATRRIFLGETISSPQHYVAIKWLHSVHLDPEQEESFLQETRFLQQLRHPHILPLITSGSNKGLPYIVTEYASGGSLDKTMQHQAHLPWDIDQALSIIFQIGQALQYAHQQNILHCNLKPQNILFNEQREALLTDFRLVSLPDSLHASAISTYMAPEQFIGTITRQSDQYALGCIAYEMLTGRTPYHTQSLQYPGSRQRAPKLIPPTQFNHSLPPHVEQAILIALALEPAQRYNDIQAFLTALGATTISSQSQRGITSSANTPITAAQIFASSNFFEEAPFDATHPTPPLADALHQGKNIYTPGSSQKTSVFKQRKLLTAIICTFVLVSLAGGLSLLAFASPKLKVQATPMLARTNIPASTKMTTTAGAPPAPTTIITPTMAATPTPTATTHPIVVQPRPTTIPAAPTPTPTATSIPTPISVLPTATPTSTVSTGTLTINPTQLSSANCQLRSLRSYWCTITLSLSASFSKRQTWFAYSTGVTARIIPFIGTIAPGRSTRITIIVFDRCTHPGAFVFTIGSGHITSIIPWAC